MNNKKTKKCVLISNFLRGGLGFPGLKLRASIFVFHTPSIIQPRPLYWGLTAWYINMNLKGFVKTDEKLRNYRKETWRKLLVMNKGRRKSSDEQLSLASLFLFCAIKKHRFYIGKNLPPSCGLLSKALWTSKEKRKVAKLRSSHAEDVLYHTSGSARVFGYTVYRGFLNRVYGILQLKDEYSVYHFL